MHEHDFLTLSVSGLTKTFGGFTALSDVDLQVKPGMRLGVIGPNGSGKTTLMNCISGVLAPNTGTVLLQGLEVTRLPSYKRAQLGIARTFQIPKPFQTMTLIDNLRVPMKYALKGRVAWSDADSIAAAHQLLTEFGLGAWAHRVPTHLSQVQLRKLELARAMAAQPRILISDEAMAGLSHSEVDEVLDIVDTVSAKGVTVIMIEHIMRAIMRFSEYAVCLDAGRIVARGVPAEVMRDPHVKRAYLGD